MCIAAHDTFQNNIVAIALESGTHVKRKVPHLLPHHTRRGVDICELF
jgi:hypothetical protein